MDIDDDLYRRVGDALDEDHYASGGTHAQRPGYWDTDTFIREAVEEAVAKLEAETAQRKADKGKDPGCP